LLSLSFLSFIVPFFSPSFSTAVEKKVTSELNQSEIATPSFFFFKTALIVYGIDVLEFFVDIHFVKTKDQRGF
jgi:hypothetical protein